MDRILHAGSIHGHGHLYNPAARNAVVGDLGVFRAADENAAVRGLSVKFAGVKTTANESLADDIVDDLNAIGVADENPVDEGILDPVALDGDVAVLKIVLKTLRALGRHHADIDRAERGAAACQLVGAGDAVVEMIVPERQIVGKSGLGPKADITACLQRIP